jgi:GT2 family glycosyltransferase
MTLVSIITPSYNQAAYLEQTLRSVLEQDYAPIEYLVVDGGSTDGSVEILQRYAARLSWWVSERDRGQAAFVYGDVLSVDAQGRPFHHQRYRPLTLQDLLCFHIIGQPAVFMRRDALEQAGRLDPSYHYLLDHHLWIRLAQVGEMVYVPQLWAAARYHPMAKNRRQALAFGEEAFRILDWAEAQPELGGILRPIRRRARAGAFFLQARYLRDGGDAWKALRSWHQGLFLAPALLPRHFSLGVSIWLSALGLDSLRHLVLRHR